MGTEYFINQIKNCKSINDLYFIIRNYRERIAYKMGKYVEDNWNKVTLEQWNSRGFYFDDVYYGINKKKEEKRKNKNNIISDYLSKIKSNPITSIEFKVDWDGDLIFRINDYSTFLTPEKMYSIYMNFCSHYENENNLLDKEINDYFVHSNDINKERLGITDYSEIINKTIFYNKEKYEIVKYKEKTNEFIVKLVYGDYEDYYILTPFDIEL